MTEYQVIARKFRPQTFKDVMGQEAIVTTLKNGIKFNRLAQAYLFCGSRGTGKTSLARLLAKALNCLNPSADCEPCNQCSSCNEITSGFSLDVLEIDGASHRGIEDIRQINETVGYTTASGQYKIYIIDEVHMLTKEAFNALLKTLEEPPAKVKFFFATTEPHKVPSTILSRCQRFNLNRISLPQIKAKLGRIAAELKVEIEEDALHLLAQRAEGGLRDAESLLDQVIAFEEGTITIQSVTTVLGLLPTDVYFTIDKAGKEGDFIQAFKIAHQLFNEGKELSYFIEGLIDHLRKIAVIKVSGLHSPFLNILENEKEKYQQTALLYTQEQCMDLIEYLLEALNQLKHTSFGKTSLETILLHVMRSHFRLSIEQLVYRLNELEGLLREKEDKMPLENLPPKTPPAPSQPIVLTKAPQKLSPPQTPKESAVSNHSISVDPTPTPADLGKMVKKVEIKTPSPALMDQKEQRPVYEYDTLMHFAAVELEGRLQKH